MRVVFLQFVLLAAMIIAVAPLKAQEETASVRHQASDTVASRLNRIDSLIGQIQEEVRALRHTSFPAGTPAGKAVSSPADTNEPYLLTDARRKRIRANATPFRQMAVGYAFGTQNPISITFLGWKRPWGAKVFLSAFNMEVDEFWFIRGDLRRTITSTDIFGAGIDLFAFGGTALKYEMMTWFDTAPNFNQHSNPDLTSHWFAGLAPEISGIFLGGVKVTPEFGYQYVKYIWRYQDAAGYAGGTKPDYNFEFKPFFGLQMDFYFK